MVKQFLTIMVLVLAIALWLPLSLPSHHKATGTQPVNTASQPTFDNLQLRRAFAQSISPQPTHSPLNQTPRDTSGQITIRMVVAAVLVLMGMSLVGAGIITYLVHRTKL